MNETKNCQWRVARRPEGNVVYEDFEYREVDIPQIQDGEVLLKTLYLNLAPVMRMYMSGESAAGEQSLDIGDVIHGRGVAEIIQSKHANYQEGEIVQGQMGWQTYKRSKMTEKEKFRKIPDTGAPYSLGLSLLGMTGLSAYFGYFSHGNPNRGETVVVSGAAGGVGSTVVQFAKMLDCYVIGIAGGKEKCDFIETLGCDLSIDYKSGEIEDRIKEAAPNGIDLYFDNVGGEILTACMENLAMNSRVVHCGSISEYLDAEPFGLKNYTNLRRTNSSLKGFFIYNHMHEIDSAEQELNRWIKEKKIRPVEHIVEGFMAMPEGLAQLYDGSNHGVALCKVRQDPNDQN